jgi:hypothetical protein
MKRSPRGLFDLKPMGAKITDEEWVISRIEDGEAWALATLRKAGLEVVRGSELDLTSKRPAADPVHLAAVTVFQARRLREWLKTSQAAGAPAAELAFHSAFRMAQFMYAAFLGSLVEIEPIIDAGRRTRFGGTDGANERWKWHDTAQRKSAMRAMVEKEIAGGAGKMAAYKKVARRFKCHFETVRRAMSS